MVELQPTPAGFATLTEGTHIARFRALLLTDRGQTGGDPTGEDLIVIAGSVTLDISASIRATATLTIADVFPTSRSDLDLAPFGKTEIFLARGIDQGQNGVLWSPLGYYRITTLSQNQPTRGEGLSTLTLTLHDRMATIVDSRLPVPMAWSAGTSTTEIVTELVTTTGDLYEGVTVEYGPGITATNLARQVVVEEERYAGLETVATALGGIAFWTRLGTLIIAEPVSTVPDLHIRYGSTGTLIGAPRTLTRAGLVNGVMARGEGTDDIPPVQSLVVDNDDDSPTKWGGPFGKVVQFFSSPLMTTVEQCTKAATSVLIRKLSTQQDIQVEAIVNPAVSPGHVVVMHWPDSTVTTHTVTSVTIPLEVTAPMQITMTAGNLALISSLDLSEEEG